MSNARVWRELRELCNYDMKEIKETLKYLNDRFEEIKGDKNV